MPVLRKLTMTAMLTAGAALLADASAFAMPNGLAHGSAQLAALSNDGAPVIEVRHRRGRRAGAGFAAGVLIGSALAYPYYYRTYPYAYYSPAYPVYGPYSAGDPAIAYCMRRFHSYDPYTRTYLGYDGFRHPCP
jgi:hypothetical protein